MARCRWAKWMRLAGLIGQAIGIKFVGCNDLIFDGECKIEIFDFFEFCVNWMATWTKNVENLVVYSASIIA